MEVQTLKLAVVEQDLNDLIRKYLPADHPIEQLTARVNQQGVVVTGIYPLFINVHFETIWELGLDAGQITARLANFKAMGVPGNIFKSAIVKMIEELAVAEKWVRIKGDTLWVDADACIAKFACSARTNFKVLTCEPGRILLESRTE